MISDIVVDFNSTSFTVYEKYQKLIVQEWGANSVRVTSYPKDDITPFEFNGILELSKNENGNTIVLSNEDELSIESDRLKVIYKDEKLTFYRDNIKILEEYSRKQSNVRRTIGIDEKTPIEEKPSYSLNISPREFQDNPTSGYSAYLRFEGDVKEKIFGLGGYQEEELNKNLSYYELMHRNSQTSIPFYISSKNYSFIWNNSSIGHVFFGKNQKYWKANNTQSIDYIVSVGKNPKELLGNYTSMVGRPPMVDVNLLGLWQSKLRYQTIDELKAVYEQYDRRKIQLSVLIIDYFHWTEDGNFEFDMDYWKGIQKFAKEVNIKGTNLMVSIWPTVTGKSKYYNYYKQNQMFINSIDCNDEMFDGKLILDFSNPKTQKFVSKLLELNYGKNYIHFFWADQAEPEMDQYIHSKYRIYEGEFEKFANRYPLHYLKAFRNSLNNTMNPVLIRSSWFNSSKYGALAWSGDIDSSFKSLKRQIQICISMGIVGNSWWTNDIAGFHSGDSSTSNFKELMIRWFQFSVFSPILRMHGDRQPHTPRIGNSGGGVRTSGAANEIWSFGKEVELILMNQINLRNQLKDYIEVLFKESHSYGYPIVRSLFFEFPEDDRTWGETNSYMFGSSLLVVPITEYKQKHVIVYLPKGHIWIDVFTNKEYVGGNTYKLNVNIKNIPVFYKKDSEIEINIKQIFK